MQTKLKKVQDELKQDQTKSDAAKKKAEDSTKALMKPEEELRTADLSLQSALRGIESSEQSAAKATAAAVAAKNAIGAAEEASKAAEAALAADKAAAGKSEGPFRAVAFSRDGGILYTVGDDGLVQSWSAIDAGPLATIGVSKQPLRDIQPTAMGVVTLAADKSATHWNTAPTWALERTIGKADDASILADRVLALEYSPDGKLLASGGGEPSRSGEIKFWNPLDGALVKALTDPHSDTVFAVRFSPDGSQIASCGADRFMKVYNVSTGTLEKAFEGHTHHVLAVAWRMDGRTLASGSADNTVKVWDLKTGEQKRTVPGYGKEITSLSFFADTMKVLVSCGDNTLRVMNTDNGQNERSLGGSSDFVYSVRSRPTAKSWSGVGKTAYCAFGIPRKTTRFARSRIKNKSGRWRTIPRNERCEAFVFA
ncbi:MAG: WD40 repeat domain-containing protein [Pirellulales bacterium]